MINVIDMDGDMDDDEPTAENDTPAAAVEDVEEMTADDTPQSASASDAAKLLKALSSGLVKLYDRYSGLHGLARELNGHSESEPLPDHIDVKHVTLTYTVNNGAPVVAEVLRVKRVGEISELLRTEIERIVDDISVQLAKIREVSTASEQACNNAKYYARMAQSKNVPS